jgi:hypothetical protein
VRAPLLLALAGCAKNAPPEAMMEAPPPPMEEMAPPPPPPEIVDVVPWEPAAGAGTNGPVVDEFGMPVKGPQGRSYQQAVSTPTNEEAPPPEPTAAEGVQDRMIHYTGYARIRATKVHETLDAVAKLATEQGGRVEQLSETTITVRVPVALFDAAWKEVLGLGDVLDRSVSAEDVTDAFTEVDLRVHILQVTRDRLVQLLAKAESEDEKLALLREIQSTTERLDQIESQLRTLRGLADYSRITVEVVAREAVASGGAGGPTPAGMEWIASLSPFRRDLRSDDHRVALPVPEGMVSLSPKGPFVAESPEGVALWTGRLENEPRGDAAFWIDAVTARLGTDFANATSKSLGPWKCVELVDASEEPYTWDVCVQVDPVDRKLWLGEVYYPTAESKVRYQPAIDESFSGGVS